MGESREIHIPDIGDFQDVDVIEVPVNTGDRVSIEDTLVTLETDKATMDVPSPASGIVEKMSLKVGDKVSEGSVVLVLAEDEVSDAVEAVAAVAAEPVAAEPEKAVIPEPQRPPQTLPPPAEKSGVAAPHASPGVRKFARELGADLGQVRGTGPKGRILKENVQEYIKRQLDQPGTQEASSFTLPQISSVDFAKFGEVESKALGRIKKLTAKHLHSAWLNVPHVTHHDEADITEMEAFRQSLKKEAEQKGLRVTALTFIMKAVVAALKAYPQFNASLSADGEQLIFKKYFHIGIAVDTPNGLVVPVFRDVEQKSIFDLAAEMAATSARARDGKLKPTEMQGGCISISSLGGIGGTAFTPIVNIPEVAILGVSRASHKPVWDSEAFQPRLMLPLDLSYDHRVIDGAEAARFTAYLAKTLADIRRLIL